MWFQQQTASGSATWEEFAALTRRMTADEAGLRRRLWRKLLREAASLPFAEEVLTAITARSIARLLFT